jgi:hypothetical protein
MIVDMMKTNVECSKCGSPLAYTCEIDQTNQLRVIPCQVCRGGPAAESVEWKEEMRAPLMMEVEITEYDGRKHTKIKTYGRWRPGHND